MSKKILIMFLMIWGLSGLENPLQAKERTPRIKLSGDRASEAPKYIKVADIEKLPLTEYTVLDPYSKQNTTYKGVLLREFISIYGVQGVEKITTRAIDDYVIDFERKEWALWDILLATQKNGKYMSIKEGGPARIVFPYHKSKDINQIKYHPKWIWQINRIEFFKNK